MRRWYPSRRQYAVKSSLTCCYGFKIDGDLLLIPLGNRSYWRVPLSRHTLQSISDLKVTVRSFMITATQLSLCYSCEIPELECNDVMGIDRNFRNLTAGNDYRIVQYNLADTVRIAERSVRIVCSFKRNDSRITEKFAAKYGRRRRNRIQQRIHNVTKRIVKDALETHQAMALENIEGIRNLYRRGNGRGQEYRRRMNGWRFGEAQCQIEYKARWAGLRTIRLTRTETKSTSITCPRCGERLQEDKRIRRKLWCGKCRYMMDRDVVAAINLSRRGRLRFDRSRALQRLQGGAVEAVRGNLTPMVILRVDALKSGKDRYPWKA